MTTFLHVLKAFLQSLLAASLPPTVKQACNKAKGGAQSDTQKALARGRPWHFPPGLSSRLGLLHLTPYSGMLSITHEQNGLTGPKMDSAKKAALSMMPVEQEAASPRRCTNVHGHVLENTELGYWKAIIPLIEKRLRRF